MNFITNRTISPLMRIEIGVVALKGVGIYGVITDLARQYNISRPTVYAFKEKLIDNLYPSSIICHMNIKQEIEKIILALKFCCKSSITGISEALRHLGYGKYTSIGYISEFLKDTSIKLIGEFPKTNQTISILADEIFVCGQPVLVIIDALSHTILAIELACNRTGDTWNDCFMSLVEKGYEINFIAKDLGSGLAKGVDLMNDNEAINIISQADLFHLLIRFNQPLASLEKKAYGAIEEEEKRIKVLNNRKSEESKLKSEKIVIIAQDKCKNNIDKYDDYNYLRYELHEAFNPFNFDGTFRNEKIITDDVTAILSLLEERFPEHYKIDSAIKFLRKNLSGYFPYITKIENIVTKYSQNIPVYLINEVCLSYQKGLKSVAIKDYQLSKKIGKEADEHFIFAQFMAENNRTQNEIKEFSDELSKSIRSSSALEAKNSVLKEFFNSSSGQITQGHLNLIAFYMNRKIAIRGKYKGKSPLERLTGEKANQNFIHLLMTG